MSISALLAISKMRFPETEETLTFGYAVVPEDQKSKESNALRTFANGAWLGIRITAIIVATLLYVVAFVGMVNGFLTWSGRYLNLSEPELTLEL